MWREITLYRSSVCPSVRTYIRISVRQRFVFDDPQLKYFRRIFFKLCMRFDIGDVWFGIIANGLISFINKCLSMDTTGVCTFDKFYYWLDESVV